MSRAGSTVNAMGTLIEASRNQTASKVTTEREPRTPSQVAADIKTFLRNLPLEPDGAMRTVVNLFEYDRGLFLDLALVGVDGSASEGIMAAARIAAKLRNVNRGVRVEESKGCGHVLFFAGSENQVCVIGDMPIPYVSDSIDFTGVGVERVRKMCDTILFQRLFGPYVRFAKGGTSPAQS